MLYDRGMTALTISPAQRKALKAKAHDLSPVVMIGNDGLTPGVVKEAEIAINSHNLIKVRVFGDDRENRIAIYEALCDKLNAAPVQHIGKLLVLWRPKAEKKRVIDEDRMPGPREVKVLKYSSRGGQRPEVKRLQVLGNQRLTAGGQVKRAKPKQRSIKKTSQS